MDSSSRKERKIDYIDIPKIYQIDVMVEEMLERYLTEQKDICERLFKNGSQSEDETGMKIDKEILQCPPTFDGLLCWPRTLASRTAILPCPPGLILGTSYDVLFSSSAHSLKESTDMLNNESNILKEWITSSFNTSAIASKLCLANGQWYINDQSVAWSNYTLCIRSNNVGTGYFWKYVKLENTSLVGKWLPIIKTVSQIGYASSFATLLVAMTVFTVLRKLRNPRNRLHMHLFMSFMMRAFMALLKEWVFVDGIGLAWDIVLANGDGVLIRERNTWACKIITSMWQYFIVANYAWILMEGLYLHNLIFLALCTDTTAITSYILLGWGLPGLIVIPWVIIRATIEDTLCWTTHHNPSFFLIVRIPIVISILFNFGLFVNIVRVLLIKLKTSVHLQHKKMQYRRWAKSTLILVPLFGAHYTLFLGLSYQKDNYIELVWLFCDQLFASFQGAFVALLYCLLNGEVRAEARRAWKARRSKKDSLTPIHRDFFKISQNQTRCVFRRHDCDDLNFSESTTKHLSTV
ncbi:secretin receptor-like [Vespa crabro]|uniref:secretin receptor-like n=1 Tax=Vespa crabro TaxID=7445 RepID=UPI001F005CCB|nr:secretin receptor-like [Vespa crabro]XP_046813180.1 secretin receptor-like [Vespa crabro]